MGTSDTFTSTPNDAPARGALDEAADLQPDFLTRLIEDVLSLGIKGMGPFESASEVAGKALEDANGNVDQAISKVITSHTAIGAAGGFVTGVGGFVTMPIALPLNVFEFFTLATRMTAAVAHLRGYDPGLPEMRSAILLTLVGSEVDEVLARTGVSSPGGRATMVAMRRLPKSAVMVVNKAIGFRLLRTISGMALGRLGRALPFIGGGIGAAFDAVMMKRIADQAMFEFPPLVAGDTV